MKKVFKRLAPVALAVTLITLLAPAPANAVPTSVSLSPSNPTKGAAGDVLTWNWTGYTNATVKCVKVQYSVNADGTGGIPAGMVVSGTTFAGTYLSGQTFAATDTNAATGTVVYSNATGVAAGTGAKSFTITSITNSSASNAYVGVTTYDGAQSAGACTGSVIDATTTVALAFTDNTQVTVTVDPTFTFAVVGGSTACNSVGTGLITSTTNTVAFGHLGAGVRAYAAQNFNVTTNAGGGYVVYLKSSAASANVMKATGTRVIADVGAAQSVPAAGTAFFGYTTNAAASGVTSGQIATVPYSGAAAVTVGSGAATAADSSQCVGYAIGSSATTPADTYSATMVYTAVPTF